MERNFKCELMNADGAMAASEPAEAFRIVRMTKEEEAKRVSEFLLSDYSFDDVHHTPGELHHFRTKPFLCLTQDRYYYLMAIDNRGELIGTISFLENEHHTGGYILDYLVVHRSCRHVGVATALMNQMTETLRSMSGRYIETFTCDMKEYEPVRKLFQKRGFRLLCHMPDYYYEGEGKMLYYLQL